MHCSAADEIEFFKADFVGYVDEEVPPGLFSALLVLLLLPLPVPLLLLPLVP